MNYTIPTHKFNLSGEPFSCIGKIAVLQKNVFTEVAMHGGSHNLIQFL